jgi:hypothetical protein
MKATSLSALRWLMGKRPRRFTVLCVLALAGLLLLLAGPSAGANDVYSNIGPAPQLPPGGLVGRYPIANYQLDQYFPGISVGLTSGVDVSGVAPLIAYFIAQVIWMITAFVANGVITLFAFAFNLDLVNGNGSPGSGALTPVSTAIHNLYTSTFGAPWLVAMVVVVGCWAMWKALVQRRYTETAGALAVSLLYCILAIGIVTQPERTIGPASKLSNQLSTALLSLTSQGTVGNESQAKSAASDQLFELLILNPWTVLEFGGVEHCTTGSGEKTRSVAVRPLSSNPTQDTRLAAQLASGTELQAQGKTCINDRNKYASHFLAFPFQSHRRNSEHEALEKGSDEALPASDPAKTSGTYPLGDADKPAAEAMGKGGQYQRLLLSIVILLGELGAFLLLGALALGVLLAAIQLLLLLAFAPVALLIGIFPGRGHEFFRTWLAKLASYLARKVIYSLILAVILAVCQALNDATSNLGWLLAFGLQAALLWSVFLQRNRLTSDFLAATVGPRAGQDGTSRLQTLYYTTRLARMAMGRSNRQPAPVAGTESPPSGESPPPSEPPPSSEAPPSGEAPPEGGGSPPPHETPPSGEDPPPGGGTPRPNETPTRGPGSPSPAEGTPPGAETPGPGEIQSSPGDASSLGGSPTRAAGSPRPVETSAPGEDAASPGQASRPGGIPSQQGGSPAPSAPSPEEGQLLPAPRGPLPEPGPALPAPSAPPPGVTAPRSDEDPSLPEPSAPPPVASAHPPDHSAALAGRASTASIPPSAPADEPVAVLLRARAAHTATDPATQGEDWQ